MQKNLIRIQKTMEGDEAAGNLVQAHCLLEQLHKNKTGEKTAIPHCELGKLSQMIGSLLYQTGRSMIKE